MKLFASVCLSGLVLAATPAFAAERGFFVGAGMGQMNTQVDDFLGSDFDFDEDDTAFKVFGGYTFFPWLGLELAYIDGGKPQIKGHDSFDGIEYSASLGIEVQSVVASVIFSLPIGSHFEVFAKPGFAYWASETTVHETVSGSGFSDSNTYSEDDEGSAFFIGAGAGFHTGPFGLRLEYEWFEVAPEYDNDSGEFVDELDATSKLISLSATYRF